MKIKLILVFFVFGLIISFICGLIAGNKIGHVIFVSLVSGATLAGIGFGLYTILEKKIPEFVEFMEDVNIDFAVSGGDDDYETVGSRYEGSAAYSNEYASSSSTPNPSSNPGQTEKRNSAKSDEGHLVIDNITIKNEPKLMAEAIRTMLSKDESEGISANVQQQIANSGKK